MSESVIIQIDSGKMKAAARVIENQKSIIMSCFASIRDDINMLKSRDWEGDSAEAYIQSIDKLLNDRIIDGTVTTGSAVFNLKTYMDILIHTGAEFEKNEVKQEERVKSLRTEIFSI